MVTTSDSLSTVDLGRYFAILSSSGKHSVESYIQAYGGHPVPEGFSYNSGTNEQFLTVEQLRELIFKHVDSEFRG